ncbi:MAG TPA: DUF4383 domain-containing protein [Actinomycetes bacterium]
MQARRFALVFGAVYVAVGILGFVVTGFSGFAATSGDKLLLFGVNPLHNLVHIAVGAVWLIASRKESTARLVSALIGAVYLLVGVLGLFLAGGTSELNLLNLNQPDNLLHFASALLALYFGLSPRRTPASPEPIRTDAPLL